MAHRPIETYDLMVFSTVARCGSLGAAAADLGLATPSVSARIAALERRLGTPLLARGARGSTATPAGERLLDYAHRCLDLLDEARLSVPAESTERLVLAAPASIGAAVFPAAVTALAGVPVTVHCRVAHSGEVVGRIEDGSVHAGFLVAKTPLRALRSRRLERTPLVAVCRPEHPLAGRRRLAVRDLTTTPVSVYRWGAEAQPLAALFADDRRGPDHPVHTFGLPSAAVALAARHGHVAVVPRWAAGAQLRAGTLVRLPLGLSGWALDLRFVYTADTAPRAGVHALREALPAIRAALAEQEAG